MNPTLFLETIGDFFELVGAILIAYAALRVHHRFRYEHKVDEKIFVTMKKEMVFGICGIIFTVLGFVIKIIGRFELIF